ncbi:hypothetical protein [Sorangium sp. So ce1151]|uniref:hypothetical protein n=1 Tax=Sorangium sp. So ce1151 TaxID=3133332 RepID=UPI003F609327
MAASLRPEGPGFAAELVLPRTTQVNLAVPGDRAHLYLDDRPVRSHYDAASGTAWAIVPEGRHRLSGR